MTAGNDKIALFGSFGYGNIGDEAVPAAFGRMIAAAGATAEIMPISRFAKAPMPGIRYMADAARMTADLGAGEDVFVVGGGIIEPTPNSCLNRAAELRGKTVPFRVLPFAVSCEPGVPFGFAERRKLRAIVRDLPEVLVRDENSQIALERLVDGIPIRVIGDIVLWLEPAPLPEPYAQELPARYIAVTLADVWSDASFFDWLAQDLARIARARDATVLLMPISNAVGDDVTQHAALRDRLAAEYGVPAQLFAFEGCAFPKPEWIAEVYRKADLVVSSRLHGCIIAYAQRTPFVGIGYHPKLEGFAKTVGWESMIVPKRLPQQQSPGAYGYSVQDLEFRAGALADAAQEALAYGEFSARDFYRMKQVQAFRQSRSR